MTTKKKDNGPAGPEGAAVDSWRGYTRYQCTACLYDTLDLEKFEDHYRTAHGALESHADPKPVFDATPPAPVGETFVQE